jgi:DNA-binding NarL/FixJ family response regulator
VKVMDCTLRKLLTTRSGSTIAQLIAVNSRETTFTPFQFNAHDILTQREQEVIVGVANGMTTRQIAASLGISFKTAECHRLRLMQKLNVHSTALVVRYAVHCGLVEV